MTKNQKEYTGTWIPRHIIEDMELKPSGKILYATIASFETCYATNAWLAKMVGVKVRRIQVLLTELEDKGYVARFEDEAKGRYIIPLPISPVQKSAGGYAQNDVGGVHKTAPINNNINNNEINSIVSFSEDIKKLYHGWLIEFIIGAETWLSLDGEQRAEEIKRAENKVRLTPKRSEKFRLRLNDAGFKMCARAIKNLAKSEFHRGENNTNWKASPEWLFNSYEKIEEWANKKEAR